MLKDVPDSPEVGSQPAARLRQMKEITRRFAAHQFWDPDNTRFELRLLVQPVHRYQDEAAKLTDGAVFVLAHGTNPEVLLQIEAHAAELLPRWKYSLARLGSAEIHVLLDAGGSLDGTVHARRRWLAGRSVLAADHRSVKGGFQGGPARGAGGAKLGRKGPVIACG